MDKDATRVGRRSIRLRQFDYSEPGMYYVTMRTKGGECLFGDVVKGEVRLSGMGTFAEEYWQAIPEHFLNVSLDLFVVMPNHVHGILVIKERLPAFVRVEYIQPIREETRSTQPTRRKNEFQHVVPGSLGSIIRSYKAAVTRICHKKGMTAFKWQRDLYDHIIRDGKDLDRIRKYILDNPANWANDENFPGNIRMDEMQEGDESWSAMD